MKRKDLVALIVVGVLGVGAVISNKWYHDYKILRNIRDFSSPEFREGLGFLPSDFEILKHVDFSDYNKLNRPETRTSTKPATYSTETKPSREY